MKSERSIRGLWRWLCTAVVLGMIGSLFGAAEAQAQVQTFFVVVPATLKGEEREAYQECAERLNAALVNTGQFRANADAETQRTVTSCVGETASASAKRECELSIANVEVDWLMMLSSRRIGGDWKWGVSALSPAEGGAQKWGGDEKPAGITNRVQAAYEACDLLGKEFACAQGVETACTSEPVRNPRSGPLAPPRSVDDAATLEVIRVTPSPASVLVDGREVGDAPNQFGVTPGQHTVELRAPGHEPWTGTFEVAAGKTYSLAAVTLGLRPAVLSVSCNVGDASILVDGHEVGRTRRNEAVELQVAPDARKVEVQRDGYASVAESLALTAGGRSSVTMRLEVASAAPKAADCPAGYVRIAPGTFTIGSPTGEEGRDDDETQRSVTITRAFCMKVTEVTQGEWQAVMGSNPSYFKDCGANCPVEQVSWEDAVGYANALSRREGLPECYAGSTFAGLTCTGYRLPTEAEWEYAARAGTTGATYGRRDSVAWYEENSGRETHPVGQKRPNAWGLYDMLGNVWEWTGDWYGEYSGTVTDPTGPARGSFRVGRGGSWAYDARYARAALRRYNTPAYRFGNLGFRLSMTAP
jgi:formylglycine-generating enzyme required for sulfatase activity